MPKKHGIVPEKPRPLTAAERQKINILISANQQKVRDISAHFEQQKQAALETGRAQRQVQRSVPPKFESYTSMNFNIVMNPQSAESAEDSHERLVSQIKREIRSQPPDHALYLSTIRHLRDAAGRPE